MTRAIGVRRLVMVMIAALLTLTVVGPVHPAMALSCASDAFAGLASALEIGEALADVELVVGDAIQCGG